MKHGSGVWGGWLCHPGAQWVSSSQDMEERVGGPPKQPQGHKGIAVEVQIGRA